MKKIVLSLLCVLLLVPTIPSAVFAEANTSTNELSAEELASKILPIVQSYDVDSDAKVWMMDEATRFVIPKTEEYLNNDRLKEVVELVSAEFLDMKIPTDKEISKYYVDKDDISVNDIVVTLADIGEITDDSNSEEAYKINIDETGVEIVAASENAALHAFRTIQHTMLTNNNTLANGTIIDYPDMAERRVHVDTGRKYFTKDWLIQHIRELSYLKMNALQIHFSENMGYRIESDYDPEIVSRDGFLTKEEVREIMAEADKYGINIIPSLDTPGHVEHILKVHPEYGQISIDGTHSDVALDVTNPKAVEYIKGLYSETMELFEGATDFHIGADEYMEFDRAPFTTEYKEVLNDYAKEELGEEYIWKDVMADYINDIAAHVYEGGFKPRIWNDGIYYGETDKNSWDPVEPTQKIVMHDYIGIDFWSQMAWNKSIAKLNTFVEKGHTEIYNINASFFYYVLRPDMPTDGRKQHSFDHLNQDERIYNEWSPGKFQENTVPDDSDFISGASLAIWNDKPDLVGEDVITEDISKELRSLASKSWNIESNQIATIDQFKENYGTLGNVAAFEKGSKLPEVEPVKVYTSENRDVTETNTFPQVQNYTTNADGYWNINENARFYIVKNDSTFENEQLYEDVKLISSEFADKGIPSENVLDIVIGSEEGIENGDIVITMEQIKETDNEEGYKIEIKEDNVKISATNRDGLFYGLRTLEKTLIGNDNKMHYGTIIDYPEVELRSFHLDLARKFYTKDWIISTIKDLSYQNISSVQLHFSENEGFRLESALLEEEIPNFKYPSDGYYTKEDMLEIIEVAKQYHIEIIPSFDTPGHLGYVLGQIKANTGKDYSAKELFPSDGRASQTFNVFESEEAREFLLELVKEFAEFFSENGSTRMHIGGDEFLNDFYLMNNDQHKSYIDYINEAASIVKSEGMIPRGWNDGLLVTGFDDYKLDSDIEITYWGLGGGSAPVNDFLENGNNVVNFVDVYMYYVLSPWWMQNANAKGNKIYNEWNPGKMNALHGGISQDFAHPYPTVLKGASYAVWSDVPSYQSEEKVAEEIYMRTRSMADKAWSPMAEKIDYDSFEQFVRKIDRVPSYKGDLPKAKDVVELEDNTDPEVNKASLADLVSSIEDKDEEDYTKESWNTFSDALAAAKAVLANEEATQAEVDAALENLQTALDGLTEKEESTPVNKSKLEDLVNNNADKDEEDYTKESWDTFSDALAAAKAVLVNEEATQAEVDAALENIQTALDGLTEKEESTPVNKSKLEDLVNNNADKDEKDYTKESWNTFSDALAAAKAVLANEEATKAEVDAALENLQTALDGLTEKEESTPVNKSKLEDLVNNNADKDEEDYTKESWTTFSNALAAAKAVLANEEATQAEVDANVIALKSAIDELKEVDEAGEQGKPSKPGEPGEPGKPSKPDTPVIGDDDSDSGEGSVLPSTATSLFNLLLFGTLIVFAGMSISLIRRRKA